MRTTFSSENESFQTSDTTRTQEAAEFESLRVKYPVHIKHRGRVLASIYKPKSYRFYRVAWTVPGGKRQLKAFARYSEAKKHADELVKDLAKGSTATALTAGQARDALLALERLAGFYQKTGRRISLHAAITEYVEAYEKLGQTPLSEAVAGYRRTVITVIRKNIKDAVSEFLQADTLRTKAAEGQRAQLSSKYAYNRKIQLNKFADAHLNTDVCDLTKAHLDIFISTLGEQQSKSRNGRKAVSAKSRNHYRASIRQFLQWAVRKDYLPNTHRLGEAEGLVPEHANNSEISYYTPAEFSVLLNKASHPGESEKSLHALLPLVAIGGLAGLRTAELLRLDWADIWRVEGHIEITSGKSKTRQRRVVQICPALATWLEPYRTIKSGKLWGEHEITFQQRFVALCESAKIDKKSIPRKHNGLRHSYCSYHYALHSNENLTAAQAGNSPAMIHAHYKGLATKTEAEKWFAVLPEKPA